MKSFLAFSVLLLISGVTPASQEPRFKVEADDLSHPFTFKELNRSGPHVVDISRRYANETEERLLRIAEAVYPSHYEVARKSRRAVQTGIAINDDRLWWCSEFDGVRIPYAITKSAVAYYMEVSEEFGKEKPREPFWVNMKSSGLTYTSSVMHKENYQAGSIKLKDVYVVFMMLEWKQWCGLDCAMGFEKSRTVVLDKKGEVLAVEGDECAPSVVS